MLISMISTITYNSLFSRINSWAMVALSLYVTFRVFIYIRTPKSVLAIVAITFGWWCFLSTIMVNGANIHIWAQVVFWPSLIAISETDSFSNNFFVNGKKTLRKIGYIILSLSILICFLEKTGISMRTNYIYQTYNLICFLPFVFVLEKNNKKILRMFVIATLLINVIFAKRGGVVALVLGVAAYYITEIAIDKLTYSNLKRAIKYVLIAVTLVVLAITIGSRFNLEIYQRMQDMTMDTGSSGRDTIWEILMTSYMRSDPITQLFGFGYNGTYNVQTITDGLGIQRGTAAHNDYIGILFNYGYIALFLLALIIVVLIYYFIVMLKDRYYLTPAFAMSLTIFLVFSLISVCAASSEIICWLAIFWGCSVAEYRKDKKEINPHV